MATVKRSAAKGHGALVRNVVLGKQGVQDQVFEKPPEGKRKLEAQPQRPRTALNALGLLEFWVF